MPRESAERRSFPAQLSLASIAFSSEAKASQTSPENTNIYKSNYIFWLHVLWFCDGVICAGVQE